MRKVMFIWSVNEVRKVMFIWSVNEVRKVMFIWSVNEVRKVMFIWSVNEVRKLMLKIRSRYSTCYPGFLPSGGHEMGCGRDSCSGRREGGMYQTLCNNPCNYFYRCVRSVAVYGSCSGGNKCVMNGRCGEYTCCQ